MEVDIGDSISQKTVPYRLVFCTISVYSFMSDRLKGKKETTTMSWAWSGGGGRELCAQYGSASQVSWTGGYNNKLQ